MEAFKERLKTLIADAQAWFARLTQRERRLVMLAGGAFTAFMLFVLLFSFASSAAGYRRRTQDKLAKLAQIQALAITFREAQTARQAVEDQLRRSSEVRLMTYVQEKGEAAGLDIPTLNPKGDVPIGDGQIIESSVEVTMTDIQMNRLLQFLQQVEMGQGMVKVKFLRLEPRAQTQTLTAWATVAAYKLKQ
jgi:general secretion pathway protein M